MKQRVRIEMNVEFNPTININEFMDRFVTATEGVIKELAKESSAKYEFTAPTTVSVSNKPYEKWHNNLGNGPTFYFDM